MSSATITVLYILVNKLCASATLYLYTTGTWYTWYTWYFTSNLQYKSALERDCDKKLWISCHDLSKYGKPHTNADTAPLGGRPVSALPTPPPPPCDYTGYDPPKKHTNRRWKSLKGTWAACGTRSPQ